MSRLFANALIFVANGGFGITTPRFVNENPIDIEGVASDSSVTSVEVSVNHGPFQSVVIDSVRKFLLGNISLVPDSNWVIAHGFNANDSLVAADSAVVILDQVLPQIVSGPQAFGVLHDEATIVFDTDEPTDAKAFWGLTPELGEFLLLKPTSTQVDTSIGTASKKRGTNHRITLEFLPADTVIYYVVVIEDRAGNSAGFSSVKSFTTKRGPDTIDPRFVEFPVIIAITDGMATVTFVTDELTTGMVYLYNEFGGYITDLDGPSDPNFEHQIKITGLSPGTKYQVRVYIEDISDNETSSGLVPFRTRDVPDTRAPTVRSIQVDPKSRATFTVITSEPAKIKIFLIQVGTAPVSKRLEDDDYIIISSDEFRRVSQLTKGGFLEGATYQFHVEAEDQSGNVGVSRPRTFKVRAPDTTPPIILYSVILQNGGEYAVLGIGTDERTTARVDYAPVDDPTDISTVFSNIARNSHIVIITNLALDTGYQFTFTVTDQSNNSTSSSPSVSARQIAEMSEAKTLFKVLQGPGQTGRFTTNQSPDTQAPVILNGPTIVAQSSDALTVQWETDELSSSIVEYGDGNFNETESLSDNVTTHTVTLSGLTSSTTYQYRISSQDPTGNGPTLGPAPLNVAAATTTIESDISPPQISNVTEASVTNDRAIITFTTDEPGDGFVDFDTDMSTFGQSLGSTTLETSHSVTITNLAPGTTYYYRARSTDANGNGPGFGGTESFTTALVPDNTNPVISNLAVRAGYRFAVITWDTDEVSNSFIQLVDGTSDTLSVASLNLKTAHSVTVADTTFLPGSANLFTVIAGSTDPSGNSGESNTQFTTLSEADTTAPEIPSGLAATAGNGVVVLTWSDISDPDFGGFLIFRILSGDTTQVATGVTDNSYLDESVANDSSYTYFLQAVDLAIPTPNISESSASIGVTPASGAEPTAPSAVSPTTNVNVSLKPILLINDATLGTSGGTLAYTFAVYSDSALTLLVASIAGIPQGTPTNPTHWQVIDPALSDSVVLSSDVKYWWRARANNGTFDGAWSPVETFTASDQVPLAVEEVADANIPKSHALSQNFPNPFNPTTRIQFALPKPGLVSITIYNVLGQEVRRLVNDQSYTTGFHYVTWDGRNGANQSTSSGVYLYRIEVKDGASQERVFQQAKKMLLVK